VREGSESGRRRSSKEKGIWKWRVRSKEMKEGERKGGGSSERRGRVMKLRREEGGEL